MATTVPLIPPLSSSSVHEDADCSCTSHPLVRSAICSFGEWLGDNSIYPLPKPSVFYLSLCLCLAGTFYRWARQIFEKCNVRLGSSKTVYSLAPAAQKEPKYEVVGAGAQHKMKWLVIVINIRFVWTERINLPVSSSAERTWGRKMRRQSLSIVPHSHFQPTKSTFPRLLLVYRIIYSWEL